MHAWAPNVLFTLGPKEVSNYKFAMQAAAEDLEEAENELMLADEEHVPYFVGECFFHIEKEQVEERLQKGRAADWGIMSSNMC